MNEHILIVGENKDARGYFAMWGNDGVIYGGDTPEKAVMELFYNRYPTIWHLNDMNNEDDGKELIEDKLGVCTKWFDRKENKMIGNLEE